MLTHYIGIGGKIKQFFMFGIITPLLWDGQRASAQRNIGKEKETNTRTIKLHGNSISRN